MAERARDAFTQLGARLWVERAEAELARIGGRPSTPFELTETERTIASLVDPVRFPALSAAVADGVFEDARPADDQIGDDVRAAMEIILDGIAALIERRSRG